MAEGRPSRKSKAIALAGLRNLHGRRPPPEVLEEEPPLNESSELSHQEGESENEFEPEPKVATRGAGRKRAPPGEGSTTAKRSRRGGARETSRKKVQEDVETEGSLFEIVKSGKTALTTVIDDWIEAYKQDRDTALLDLIQFFIHCSGCKGRITPHMYHNMEHAEIIRKMTEEFDEESGDYPLIMSGPQWKKFKANFCEFISVLVRQCQYSIIYDQYMMDNVISLLTGLTDSQVRAFRHTSTLASMKLMTSLVDVALNLSIALDHTQRQYEAERTKSKGKQATERLEMLMEKRKETEENQEEIRHMLTYIFKGVFVHRYRDSQPEIRGICTSEIGVWMKRYPSMFLDDSYLKYIGWTLYDRVGDVRLCCLRCLQPLYDTEELAPKLELFTNRFKDRIVEMTLDKEYEVAVQAVKLVISILKYNDSVLSDKDCENVYELVYSSHRGVAQAAGEFLNAKLFSRDLDEATKNLKTKKGKKRSENTPFIRDLVLFFIESELHEHGAYLVDSLWDINDMLKDWECMTDLLLEEPGKGEEALDDRHETSLIEIIVCCVKQAATGEYPVGRGTTSRKVTTKETRQVAEDKTKLTEHFIITLPQLLAKYAADAEKVANLLNIPLYFDLEIYTTGRHDKHLDALLRHIDNIVEKHTDHEVLEICSKVLELFINEEYVIANKCNIHRSTLIDKLTQRYQEAFRDFFQQFEEPDDDDAYALTASLRRIYAFFCCHDLNQWDLWNSLFTIVKGNSEERTLPKEVLCKAIACCHVSLMWQLSSVDKSNPDEAALSSLKKNFKSFMDRCTWLLKNPEDSVQEEAYISICDLLVVFSKNLANKNPALESLAFNADCQLQEALSHFLNEKVFIEDEDDTMDENRKIEELHKRRNFLASFCKLIIYNVIKIKCAADMFKYYMKFYNDYGDIIKATLGKAREINKVHTAKTLALSLTQLFRELQLEQGTVDRASEGFLAIKELARRFSLSFGLDQIKNREAVAAMHKEGILFVINGGRDPSTGVPSNLAFLEILCEFSGKLMKQDKKVVLAYLDSNFKGPNDVHGEDGAPLGTYRHSLLMGEGDTTVQPTRQTAAGKRGRGAKRKLPLDVEESTIHAVSRDVGQTPAANFPQPWTSTAIKRPRLEHELESASEQGMEDVEGGSERNYESDE